MPTQTVPGVLVAHLPERPSLPLVFDSPHSGLLYPPDFRPDAPASAVVTTCDRFVDELWAGAPGHGATLIAALFPRAYIDPNRSATDLDPDLLAEPWPGAVEGSDYTRRGMGLIRRLALPGIPLYRRKLTLAEVEHRLATYYRPYRAYLGQSLDADAASHGAVWHVNCHSMKAKGNAMNTDAGATRPDFVLSDRNGQTSNQRFTHWLAKQLLSMGYRVNINEPYKGGDLVATFGRPASRRSSLQIEINRALYLDESTYEKGPGFAALAANLGQLQAAMGAYVRAELAASPS